MELSREEVAEIQKRANETLNPVPGRMYRYDTIAINLARNALALAEALQPFLPMTLEEAEQAYDEAEARPMGEDAINTAARYATDPEYRAEHNLSMYKRQFAISRGFRAEIAKLQAFKTYVHQRLDNNFAVPPDPFPDNNIETGCRIGGRLNWLFAEIAKLKSENEQLKKEAERWKAQFEEVCERG